MPLTPELLGKEAVTPGLTIGERKQRADTVAPEGILRVRMEFGKELGGAIWCVSCLDS